VKKNLTIAIVITFLILLAAHALPSFFNGIESKWIDAYFNVRGEKPPTNDIVLVTIDERSISKLGRWPWPRHIMADLVEKLASYGVTTIAFDVTFSEHSSEDFQLAKAFKKFPDAYLGYFFYLSPEEIAHAQLSNQEIVENEKTILPSALPISSKQLETSGRKVYGVQTNVPEILKGLPPNRQGFFNAFPDSDGVIRVSPLVLFYKGQVYPSLSLQTIQFVSGFSPIPLFDDGGVLEGLAVGPTKIPLNESGEFLINYRGPGKTFSHVSIADVLDGSVPQEKLQNKIVLIGATAIGIYDMRVTPMDANIPGLEIHANIIDNILTGDFLTLNETTKFISIGLVLFVGLFFGLILSRFRPLGGFVVFLIVTTFLLLSGYYLFVAKGFVLQNFKPVLNGVLVYGGITVYRYFTEEKERRKVKKTFQHYLSPVVIKQLLDNPNQLKLGGERKELTVLFSDIRGFTTKAEKLPPEKVVQLLNDYFTVMTDIVFKYEGTVDKYMGDAIMAIFGAPLEQPDHALRASMTAIEMVEQLKVHKDEWCKKYGIDSLEIGVGVHTGPMAVGNMGSERRFNYTVIGDAVNLTSRLEGLNKDYKTQIIISDAHYKLVKDKVKARELDKVQVKGKEERVTIYELIGRQ